METLHVVDSFLWNRVLESPVYLVLHSSVMLYTCQLTFLQWLQTMWKKHLSGARATAEQPWKRTHSLCGYKGLNMRNIFNSCQYIHPKSYILELKVLFWGRLGDWEELFCTHLKVNIINNICALWEQENPSDVTSLCLKTKAVRSIRDMTADDRVTVSHTLRSIAHVCNIAFQSIWNQALILLFPY